MEALRAIRTWWRKLLVRHDDAEGRAEVVRARESFWGALDALSKEMRK